MISKVRIGMRCWLGILCLVWVWAGFAQIQPPQYRVVHEVIGQEDGLPNRFIHGLHRTDQDLLFLAHSRGLHYYDGFQFHEVDLGGHFRYHGVLALAEDHRGRLWLSDRGMLPVGEHPFHIMIYDPRRGTLRTFWEEYPEFRQRGYQLITVFYSTPEGFHIVFDHCHHYTVSDTVALLGLDLPTYWSWYDPEHGLWLQKDQELHQVMPDGKRRSFPLPKGITYDLRFTDEGLEVLSFFQNALRMVSLYPGTGVWREIRQGLWPRDIIPPGGLFNSSFAQGWRWYRDLVQLKLEDPSGKVRFTQGLPVGQSGEWLSAASAVHLDKKNEMWFLADGRLHNVSLRPAYFREQYLQVQPPASVRAITVDTDSAVFLATYKGLYRFRPGDEAPNLYNTCPIGYSFTRGRGGQLLMGTHSPMIQQFTLSSKKDSLDDYSNAGNKFDKMILYYDAPADRLWCGTPQGLLFEDSQKNWHSLRLLPDKDSGPNIRFIQRLDNKLWIGTDAGLFSIGSDDRPVHHPGPEGKLKDVVVLHMSGDDDHYFLATRDEGLAVICKKKWTVRFYNRKTDGLSSNMVYAVLPDEYGWLWMPSANGLMRMDLRTRALQVFTILDGLPENEFNTNAFYRDPQGYFLLGTINGLIRFHPGEIPLHKDVSARLYFDAILINGEPWREALSALEEAKPTIKLPVGNVDWVLVTHFSDLAAKRSFRLGYRLKHADEDWTFSQSNVLHLPANFAGTYTFEIGVFPRSGNLPLDVRELTIVVPKPWRTILLWALGIFLFAGLSVGAVLRRRTVRFRRRNQELQFALDVHTKDLKAQTLLLRESNSIKDRMLSILGHELRNPLLGFRQLSAKLAYLIRKDDRDRMLLVADTIERQSIDLLNRIDNLMEWARIQRGQVDLQPSLIDLEAVTREQMAEVQSQADAKKVQLVCACDEDSRILADINCFRFIIRNLLSNAIKFSFPGKTVEVQIRDGGMEGLVLQVRDEGAGMDSQQLERLRNGQVTMPTTGTDGEKGSGLGWTIIRELILRMGATMELDSSSAGTRVSITFPSHHRHRTSPVHESNLDLQ